MSKGSLSAKKLIGIVLIIVGAGLAIWGYQESGSIESQLSRTFSGSDTDRVMTLYIAGAASFVVGLLLLLKK
jgi:hypothetical protein